VLQVSPGILRVRGNSLQVTPNSLQVSPGILQVPGTILQVNAVLPRGPQQRMRPTAGVLHRTSGRMQPMGIGLRGAVIRPRQRPDVIR
jgi:hypothetical protein